jgi:hypothetical protein
MSGLLARRTHTIYAPGTVDECRTLLDTGTAVEDHRRLNLHAFKIAWPGADHATVRNSSLPRRVAHVRLARHDWGTTANITTQLEPFSVLVTWLTLIGCAAVAGAQIANRGDGKTVADALVPFGCLAMAAFVVLIWEQVRTKGLDDAMLHDLALALGAKSVDGISSPQYALRPNWPPPSDASVAAHVRSAVAEQKAGGGPA